MALPFIFLPPGMPYTTAQGHGITIEDQFDFVPMLQGEGRKRRLFTASPRTASIRWYLSEAEMHVLDAWFQDTLDVGERKFVIPIAKLGPGIEYWAAEWIEPYTAEPIQSKQRSFWVTGSVLLTGEPSDTLPDTGQLALDIAVSLGGFAAPSPAPNPLALDIVVSLGTLTLLQLDIVVSLGQGTSYDSGGSELRMDGGSERRMDGGLELRV